MTTLSIYTQKASKTTKILVLALMALTAILCAGCPVNQKPGAGTKFDLVEAQSGKTFYLYVPAGYNLNKRWPVAMTIHGWRPFDSAESQIREWQRTADKYGLIVIAPKVWNSGAFMKFRLDEITPSVQEDVDAMMRMLDYTLAHTASDPDRVLITGWSTAGYLVHYLGNRHHERFAALCARGCSFNPNILDEDVAKKMAQQGFPTMIFYGTDDYLNIKIGSKWAIDWYKQMGFNLETMVIPQATFIPALGFGHNRQPDIAAEFFIRTTGLKGVLRIVASTEQGDAPLPVNFSLEVPHHVELDGLRYVWTLDGEHLGRDAEIYTTIARPGLHNVQVVITDSNGKTLVASRDIIVRSPGS